MNHTGRRVLDGLNLVKQTVDVVSEVPSRYVKELVSDAIAPEYWVPNSEIKVCLVDFGIQGIKTVMNSKSCCPSKPTFTTLSRARRLTPE